MLVRDMFYRVSKVCKADPCRSHTVLQSGSNGNCNHQSDTLNQYIVCLSLAYAVRAAIRLYINIVPLSCKAAPF